MLLVRLTIQIKKIKLKQDLGNQKLSLPLKLRVGKQFQPLNILRRHGNNHHYSLMTA